MVRKVTLRGQGTRILAQNKGFYLFLGMRLPGFAGTTTVLQYWTSTKIDINEYTSRLVHYLIRVDGASSLYFL